MISSQMNNIAIKKKSAFRALDSALIYVSDSLYLGSYRYSFHGCPK